MSSNAKYMALHPLRGRHFNQPTIPYPFYFHTPGPYEQVGGDALVNETNVISQGGISGGNGRALREVSWSSIFVLGEYLLFTGAALPPYVLSPPTPRFRFMDFFDSRNFLDTMKDRNMIAKLIICDRMLGTEHDINMPVLLSSFHWKEEAGEPDCRYYSISFKEYRRQVIRRVPSTGAPVPDRQMLLMRPGRYWTADREIGIDEVILKTYGQVNTRLKRRVYIANGGRAWIMRYIRLKLIVRRESQKYGPNFLQRGAKIYMPPRYGSLRRSANSETDGG